MNMIDPIPKILVVDDEPDLELLINQKFRREIKEKRYVFFFANNGVRALEKLKEVDGIELVLTDINMPEMDGLTLLAKIKEMNNPLLHSVIVSAYGDLRNIRAAMNGGAYDFVIKPIDLNDLEITIKKALDNLCTFKKVLKSRDELIAVRKELDEARALQLSMLPKSIPQIDGLEFAVYMDTASEVGGDYYDFLLKKDGSLNIAVGDATGHGMRAGIMVAIMKTLFVSDSHGMELVDFFNTSNKTIKTLNLGRMMMAFAMMNIKKNEVRFVSAGMPSFLLYKKSEKRILEFETDGMPLGALSDSSFRMNRFNVDTGDAILILSDGLPELFNDKKELFGYARVEEEFLKTAEKSPNEIIENFRVKSAEWTGGGNPVDDVTFVVIKVK